MWGIIANILGGPIVNALIGAYKARLDAGNTSERIAADMVQRELAVQEAEIVAQGQLRIAQVGHWSEPEHLAGYVLVAYIAKVYLWDAAFHLGSTDAVNGAVGEWGALIIMFYFGKRGFENVARILKR
jgi:hypothetical protein